MKMNSVLAFAAAAVSLTAVPSTANASVVIDGSFENQGSSATFYSGPASSVGGGDGYCYFGVKNLACGNSGSPWTGTGLINPPSAFGQPFTAQNGNYYSFIQGTQILAQTFVSSLAGASQLSFWTAGRSNNGGAQTVSIFLNSVLVGNFTTNQSTPTWVQRTFNVNLASGNNLLEFRGQATTDQTAFIDNISVPAVPEPSTWAMLMLGFGLIGYVMRRRPRTSTRVSFA